MWNEFVHTLLEITLTMSAVIVLAGVIGLMTRKRYAPKWRCLVWGIIAVRLLVPVNLSLSEAPVSLPRESILTVTLSSIPKPEAETTSPRANPILSQTARTNSSTNTEHNFYQSASYLPDQNLFTPERVVLIVWILGVLGMTGYSLFLAIRFRRKLRDNAQPVSENTERTLVQAGASLKLARVPNVLLWKNLSSPMVTGLFRPVIILPTESYTDEEFALIFRHELMHIRRGDLWKKLLFLAAKILHWFNPLVWWLERTANRDIELACDAAVVEGADTGKRIAYGETLLSSIRHGLHKRETVGLIANYFGQQKNTLKERLRVIFDDRKKRSGVLLLGILFFAATLGSSLVACGEVRQTNRELTIFIRQPAGFNRSFYDNVIQHFEVEHREEFSISVQDFSEMAEDEYYEMLNGQILAGKGPDVFLMDEGFMETHSVDKMMAAGAFAPLDDYLKSDSSYRPEEYNQAIMGAGSYRDRQYVIPITYSIPYCLTSQKYLNGAGFDLGRAGNSFPNFVEECSKYAEDKGQSPFEFTSTLKNFSDYMGGVIDYGERRVHLNTPEFRRVLESYKRLYPYDSPELSINMKTLYSSDSFRKLKEGKYLLSNWPFHFGLWNDRYSITSFNWVSEGALAINGSEGEPLLSVIPSATGGTAARVEYAVAINNTSPNKDNAYQFVSYLMQSGGIFTELSLQIPVNREEENYFFLKYCDEEPRKATMMNGVRIVKPENTFYEGAYALTQKIDTVYFPNPASQVIYEEFEPYFKGQKNVDECIQITEQRLAILLSE